MVEAQPSWPWGLRVFEHGGRYWSPEPPVADLIHPARGSAGQATAAEQLGHGDPAP